MSQRRDRFDYVIVGAGSAGCVLARRLSEDPGVRVLLLEAGGWDRSVLIRMPGAFSEPLKASRLNWAFQTGRDSSMDGRRIACPRGKVVGGSSSINGMVHIRGHPRDYDRWAAAGLDGWDYAHCLPYFRRAQAHEHGANAYRGGSGPMHVTAGNTAHPLHAAWLEAGQQAGYAYTEDVNGYRQEGVGPFDRTTYRSERCSAARAYLHPVLGRPNLEVRVRAHTQRLRFDGTRALGVAYRQHGMNCLAWADREVILCAGAIGSPHILQLSGIGPAERLERLGIPVVAHLPGVGENLQDHLEVYVQYACARPVSLAPYLGPAARLWVGLQWLVARSGPATSNFFETGGFIRSRAGVQHPDIQLHFLPLAIRYDGSRPSAGHGFQAHVGPLRPIARGHVRAVSAMPHTPPEIVFNYMAHAEDRSQMRAAIRLAREIVAQNAFGPYRSRELAPGAEHQTNAALDAFVRREAESAYHPACSCKMGLRSDPMAVVDAQARVYGVAGLRVVDASIMPDIVSGNLDTPTVMLAEKLSDSIRARASPPPESPPIFTHPRWQTAQR